MTLRHEYNGSVQSKNQSFLEKLYKDKDGKFALFQWPNTPLIAWLVSLLLRQLISSGSLHNAIDFIGFGSIFTWAYLEITSGSTYLRRALGVAVLIAVVLNRI
jgi:hypothetical protein